MNQATTILTCSDPEGAAPREAMLPWAPLAGFAAFAVSYAYDSVVMWLSREQLFLH